MVRSPSASSGVVVGTVFEGGAVQYAVLTPLGSIEESTSIDFSMILWSFFSVVKRSTGEYLQGHSGDVGAGEIADRDIGSFSVKECVCIGPIGFC